MKSLTDHNAEAMERFVGLSGARKNGIACPICGAELTDSTPNIVLASHPPQYNVHCESCSYTGYRY